MMHRPGDGNFGGRFDEHSSCVEPEQIEVFPQKHYDHRESFGGFAYAA
jgi:hypothetical protein